MLHFRRFSTVPLKLLLNPSLSSSVSSGTFGRALPSPSRRKWFSVISVSSCPNRSFSSGSGGDCKVPCKFEAVRLTSRSLLRLQGADTLPFLQGLITNDISHFESRPAIYGLFLNHQGRVLWDTLLFKVPEEGGGDQSKIFIECDSAVKKNVLKHLKAFKLRKKVEILDVEEDKAEGPIDLWVVFDHGHTALAERLMKEECCGPTSTVPSPTAKQPHLPISIDASLPSFADPRLNELGSRIFVPRSKSGCFPPKDIEVSDEASYMKLRYVLGVAEGVQEILPGASFPLESNGDYLHGISFHKGCYIGQELTARTHHTGVVRKRIMPIRLPEGSNLDSVDPTTLDVICSSGAKRPLGKVRGIYGSTGIGLMRIEESLAAKELKIQDHKVQVEKPYWWPKPLPKEKQSKQ